MPHASHAFHTVKSDCQVAAAAATAASPLHFFIKTRKLHHFVNLMFETKHQKATGPRSVTKGTGGRNVSSKNAQVTPCRWYKHCDRSATCHKVGLYYFLCCVLHPNRQSGDLQHCSAANRNCICVRVLLCCGNFKQWRIFTTRLMLINQAQLT